MSRTRQLNSSSLTFDRQLTPIMIDYTHAKRLDLLANDLVTKEMLYVKVRFNRKIREKAMVANILTLPIVPIPRIPTIMSLVSESQTGLV